MSCSFGPLMQLRCDARKKRLPRMTIKSWCKRSVKNGSTTAVIDIKRNFFLQARFGFLQPCSVISWLTPEIKLKPQSTHFQILANRKLPSCLLKLRAFSPLPNAILVMNCMTSSASPWMTCTGSNHENACDHYRRI